MDQSFGASFLPGADRQSQPGGQPGGLSPQAQQAIQFLSLQLPKQMSAQAPMASPSMLQPSGGAPHLDLASAVVRSVLRALGHQIPDHGASGMPSPMGGGAGLGVPWTPSPSEPGTLAQTIQQTGGSPLPTPTFGFGTGDPSGAPSPGGPALNEKIPQPPPPMLSAFRPSGGGF